MRISDDEARALAFIAVLIGLTVLGRWVDRPRMVLPDAEVDLASLLATSETVQVRGAGTRRSSGVAAPAPRGKTAPQPRGGWAIPAGAPARSPTAGQDASSSSSSQPLLDLNRATAEELERLPGIGPSLARRILARRDSAGPYRTLEQLDSVRGVGPALLARLKPLLRLAH